MEKLKVVAWSDDLCEWLGLRVSLLGNRWHYDTVAQIAEKVIAGNDDQGSEHTVPCCVAADQSWCQY